MTDSTKTILFRLLDKDLQIKDFEQWVYETNYQLEAELQTDLYFNLTSFDYNQKDCLQQLKNKISPYIDNDEYNIWRTKRLLTDIVENNIDLVMATRKLRFLYIETEEKLIP